MSPEAHDDQALRLFRAAHADFSYRAPIARSSDHELESLIASVLEDTTRSSAIGTAPRLRLHHSNDRRPLLGIRAA